MGARACDGSLAWKDVQTCVHDEAKRTPTATGEHASMLTATEKGNVDRSHTTC
jgi:hypothetical protein